MDTAQPVPHPDVTAILPRERAAFLVLLAGLDEAEWAAPTECPAWSVKGIALHVLGDDLSLLSRQRDAVAPGLMLYAEDHPGVDFRGLLDGFNEQWVQAARFLSPTLLIELLRLTGEWTARFYATIDPDAPGEPVFFFAATGPSPYWQVAAREYVERWAHHQQVCRAVGRPDLGPEFLVPAVDVALHGLATHLPDLGATPGTTLALTVPEVAGWVLGRGAGAWMVSGRSPGPSDAELRVDPGLAAALFSRGLTRDQAAAALTVSGDPTLGQGLLGAVSRVAAG